MESKNLSESQIQYEPIVPPKSKTARILKKCLPSKLTLTFAGLSSIFLLSVIPCGGGPTFMRLSSGEDIKTIREESDSYYKTQLGGEYGRPLMVAGRESAYFLYNTLDKLK